MFENDIRKLLDDVRDGKVDVDSAVGRLRNLPYESLGFANIDHHRAIRCGWPEVIFAQGKTPDQVAEIFSRLLAGGQSVLATRADDQQASAVAKTNPDAVYDKISRTICLRRNSSQPVGHVAVVSAGTSDMPVAEEARITAEFTGSHVTTHYDVGVAGLHRLLSRREQIQSAKAIVVVAGMEGALASVVGGLVASPVIAVPTSVGYGASFQGLAALLAMLNSCASNVCAVNIDNGFSAGYIASMINRQSSAVASGSKEIKS